MKTVENEFQSFVGTVYGDAWNLLPPVRQREQRRCFYAGALALLVNLKDVADGGDAQRGLAHVAGLVAEFRDFERAVEEGRA